jgi:hypothetical protein
LSEIATALVPITATAWKTAQHFSYGARGFMRVPVSEANDLNCLLAFKLDQLLMLIFSRRYIYIALLLLG